MTGPVEGQQQLAVVRERDVGMVQDHEIVALYQALERLVREVLQAAHLPLDTRVGVRPGPLLGRTTDTVESPRVVPGNALEHGSHRGVLRLNVWPGAAQTAGRTPRVSLR